MIGSDSGVNKSTAIGVLDFEREPSGRSLMPAGWAYGTHGGLAEPVDSSVTARGLNRKRKNWGVKAYIFKPNSSASLVSIFSADSCSARLREEPRPSQISSVRET